MFQHEHIAEWTQTIARDFRHRGIKWRLHECARLGQIKGDKKLLIANLHGRVKRIEKNAKKLITRIFDTGTADKLDFKDSSFFKFAKRKENGQYPAVEGEQVLWLENVLLSKSFHSGVVMASVVLDQATVAMAISPTETRWFYSNSGGKPFWRRYLGDYMLLFPELFSLTRALNKPLTKQDAKQAREILESHRVRYEYKLEGYERKDHEISLGFKIKAQLVPYFRGAICKSLPIPGREKPTSGSPLDDPKRIDGPEIVTSSPNVAKTLAELSRIWQDRFAKSVLLSAPPGSGKERLAQSIGPGSGRDAKRMQQIALATEDQGSLERQLFGVRREDGSVEEGLIAQAAGSVLFLDEAHYPPDGLGIRAKLLRPLEANEYFPVNSTLAQSVDKVLFVFASSLPLDADGPCLARLEPQDFWTRMTHVLNIKHPLDFKDAPKKDTPRKGAPKKDEPKNEKLKQTLRDFLAFFWWDSAERTFDIRLGYSELRPEVAESGTSLNAGTANQAERLKQKQLNLLFDTERLNKATTEISAKLLQALGALEFSDPLIVDDVELSLEEELRAQGLKGRVLSNALERAEQGNKQLEVLGLKRLSELSVRGMTTIVSRAFSIAVQSVRRGEEDWYSEDFKDGVAAAVKEIINIGRLKKPARL